MTTWLVAYKIIVTNMGEFCYDDVCSEIMTLPNEIITEEIVKELEGKIKPKKRINFGSFSIEILSMTKLNA